MVRAPEPTWRDHLRRLVEPAPHPLPHVPPPLSVERALARMREDAAGPIEVASMARGAPSMIVGAIPIPHTGEGAPPELKATIFVERYKDVFGLVDVTQELRLRESGELGPMGHGVEFDQVWRGIPAAGGGLKVVFDGDLTSVRAVSNSIAPVDPGTTAEPRVPAQQAVRAARRYAKLTLRGSEPVGDARLVIGTDPARGFWSGRLAWEVELASGRYHSDASDGRVRFIRPGIIY